MSGNRHGEVGSPTQAARVPSLSLNIRRVLESNSCRQAVRATFHYDLNAPLVVTVTFRVHNSRKNVTWRIGRDLLYEGLFALSGIADVQVWPTDHEEWQTAWLKIGSRSATALFELPAPPLAEWLEDTYALVPPGQESVYLDWDAFAASLVTDPDVSAG